LRYWEDHSIQTVSELLDLSPGVVKVQSMRTSGAGILVVVDDNEAGRGFPAENLQDSFQVGRELHQYQAPAAVIQLLAAGTAEPEDGPQAGEIAVLDAGHVDVDLTRPGGGAGERGEQVGVGRFVDVTSEHEAARTPGLGNPQRAAVEPGLQFGITGTHEDLQAQEA
jgi:hypothetical protein